jgi:transposase
MELLPSMAALSDDLRARVIDAVENEKASFREVAERFKVGKTWVGKIVQRFRTTGDASAYLPIGGPGPSLDEAARAQLQAWLREQPDLTHQQLADRLADQGTRVDRSTVGRTLREMGWTRKKKSWSLPNSSARRSSKSAGRGARTSSRR